MESPAILLKSAAYELSPSLRMDKVIKACKIIADILPYDKNSQALIEEHELMTYLMLNLPLNPRAIDLIIQTMMDKFKRVNYFLRETWQAFFHVATLEEYVPPKKKADEAWKILQMGIKNLLKIAKTRGLEEAEPPAKAPSYNEEIMSKKEDIKLSALDYVEKFLVIYIKELKSSTLFVPDILGLFKKFTTATNNQDIIKKTFKLLDKVRSLDPNLNLGVGIEEALLNKSEPVVPIVKVDSEEQKKDKPKTPLKPGLKVGGISAKGKGLLQKIIKQNQAQLAEVEENKSSDENNTDNDTENDESFVEAPDSRNREGNNEIEEWLSDYSISDVPLIRKSEIAKEFISEEANFDVLFGYVIDPRLHSLSKCWKLKHPDMSSFLSDKDKAVPPTPTYKEALSFPKLRDFKQLHPYVLRSYKVMMMLCDDSNYKEMMDAYPFFIGKFFQELHKNLTTKEDLMCNLNHIVKIIEFLFSKQPKICMTYILHYNLLFKFFQNIELFSVQRLILTLFNCYLNEQGIDPEYNHKVLEYCRITSLFPDITKVILNGDKTFPKDKFKTSYKPPGITDIVDVAIESLDPTDSPVQRPKPNINKFQPGLLMEEAKGIRIDIDRIQGIPKSLRKIDISQVISTVKSPTSARPVSKKSVKRYPSLVQRNFYEESVTESSMVLKTDRTESMGDTIYTQTGFMTERSEKTSPPKLDAIRKSSFSKITKPAPLNITTPFSKEIVDTPLKSSSKKVPVPTLPLKSPGTQLPPITKKGSLPKISPIQNSNAIPLKKEPSSSKRLESISTSKGFDIPSLSPIKKESSISESPQKLQKSYSIAKSIDGAVFTAPEKKTILKEYDSDVFAKKDLEHLNELYPTSARNLTQSALDKESKKPEYKVTNIKASDQFALTLCELLDVILQTMLMNAESLKPPVFETDVLNQIDEDMKNKYQQNKTLGCSPADHQAFWRAIFVDDCKLFENLLTNYLIKIKIHHVEELNSGYASGMIVNQLLSKCCNVDVLKPYSKNIHAICKQNFPFLCKSIIQSYAWAKRSDIKVYLQDYEVTEPLGTGRISLVKTLQLIIQNDAENNYEIIYQINDTCWHTLILWFFNKKTNSIYHQLFYSIIQNAFLYGNEKLILTILFKLNLLFNLYKTWSDIYKNNVLLKDNHVESVYCYLKLFVQLINQVATTQQQYTSLIQQLSTNASWSALKENLVVKPKEPKKPVKKLKPKIAPSTRGSRVSKLDTTLSTLSMIQSQLQTPNRNIVADGLPDLSKRR